VLNLGLGEIPDYHLTSFVFIALLILGKSSCIVLMLSVVSIMLKSRTLFRMAMIASSVVTQKVYYACIFCP